MWVQVTEMRQKGLGFPGYYTQGCHDINWGSGCRGRERDPGQNDLLGEGVMSKKIS